MKLKTLLASAIAAAAVFGAWADTWFDAGISSYTEWPRGTVSEQGIWAGEAAAEMQGETDAKYLKLIDPNTELSFTAAQSVLTTAAQPTVMANVLFTAFDADSLPDVPEGAKAAVIVVEDAEENLSFRVLQKKANADENEWVEPDTTIEASTTVRQTVSFVVTLKGGVTTATYKIGDAVLAEVPVYVTGQNATAVSTFAAKGRGEIAALSGTKELFKTLTINPVEFVKVSSVMIGTDEVEPNADGTYTVLGTQEVTVYYAGNGCSGLSLSSETVMITDVAQTFNPTVTPTFFTGSGTPEVPYEIGGMPDLATLAAVCASNSTKAAYSTACFKITTTSFDVAADFVGIDGFAGTFDGNDQTLTVTSLATGANGLFNTINGNGATIKNLTVNGANVVGTAANGITILSVVNTDCRLVHTVLEAASVAATDGCTASADLTAVATNNGTTIGLDYATVDENDVATFCAVGTAGGTFQLMQNIPAGAEFSISGVHASTTLVFNFPLADATFAEMPTVATTDANMKIKEVVATDTSYTFEYTYDKVVFSIETPTGVTAEVTNGADPVPDTNPQKYSADYDDSVSIWINYDAGEGYVFVLEDGTESQYYEREVYVTAIVNGVVPADAIVKSRKQDGPGPTSDYSFTVTWDDANNYYATLTLKIGDDEVIDLKQQTSPYEGAAAPNTAIVIAATTEKVAKIAGAGEFTLDVDEKAFEITYTTEAPVIDPRADISVVKAAYGITNTQIDDVGTLSKVIGWAGAKGVTKATVNALDFTAATPSDAVKAYLFNVDPTDTDAIAAEAAKLDITSITFDENGLPVITDGANGGAGWNGTYKVQGKAALEAMNWADVIDSTAEYKFFRTIIRK